jgi:hypothetical protein
MDRQTSEKSAAEKEEERLKGEEEEERIAREKLRPFAVTVKKALWLLGDKSHSQFYDEAANGEYDLLKDGSKTLVTLESIERHNAKLPKAKIGKDEVA